MTDADVIVLGTGASGLITAIAAADAGARVTLLEKGALIGGTTALSGGVVWLPGSVDGDSANAGLEYLTSLVNDTADPVLLSTFVEQAAPTLTWVNQNTPLRLRLVERYPDYHPEHPGGRPGGGRSFEPELFAMSRLGTWADRLVGSVRRLRIGEIPSGGGSGIIPADVMTERTEAGLEGLGRALAAGLLVGCLERGIQPLLQHRAVGLERDDHGRIRGVVAETPAGSRTIRARSVVLATGGFEFEADLVRSFLRGPISHPPGLATNTGDGLRMAMAIGAELGAMAHAWWVPVVLAGTRSGEVSTLLLRERTLPGSIMLNGRGHRFVNEAANYNALGAAFHAFDVTHFRYANDPAWLVIDDACVQQFGVFGNAPGRVPSWLRRCADAVELARAIGAGQDEVTATIAVWNRDVAAGHDSRFERGESIYDGWCGDQRCYGTAAATLGPLGTGPYYLTRVFGSALGTKGGPRTGRDGQVIGVSGEPIAGLYAVGNAMAAPTGMVYGGAGGTLGPALVFGRLAGQAAAHSALATYAV